MADPTCSIDGCVKPVSARGWCHMHYHRWLRQGDPTVTLRPSGRICSVDGCDKPHECRGWCSTHYGRWQRHGSTDDPRPSVEDMFWAKVDQTDECWLWTGRLNNRGYGRFGRHRLAHRYAYELSVGPIPDGLELDHLCRTTACVRPDHLDPVTHRENVLRGTSPAAAHARKTHCPQGHEYTPDNTIWERGRRSRKCRECKRRRDRAAYAKRMGRA